MESRLGIFLIHGGLILLFVGEFITREHAIEQRMTIPQDQSVNYTEDARYIEYAFIDKSDPNHDTVVTIPERMLKKPRAGSRTRTSRWTWRWSVSS